jgi:hypothetical protein
MNGRVSEALANCVEWLDRQLVVKHFWIPSVAAAPTAFINASPYFPAVNTWLDQNPWIKGLCVVWVFVPFAGIYIVEKFRRRSPLSTRQLVTLTEVLGRIVCKKLDRIGRLWKEVAATNANVNPARAFHAI